MVALVKSLGDLPNVIYLLGYDERNLTTLISLGTQLDGPEYLKKIVQYSVKLPPVSDRELSLILDAGLSDILGILTPSQTRRLGQTWYFVLRFYLKTPRDIRLYVNSLAVALSTQRDFVDPVDLMLLEILRINEPELYNWVREHLEDITE